MPHLRKPLYQRNEGADEDRWGLVLDTESSRLFVEHERTCGDTRGAGYSISTDEIDVTAFLNEPGQGQRELVQLLSSFFSDRSDARPATDAPRP